ncbi:MAG: T9SS type A sorting domain-containing protein, partial [Flavobacteriales bacterium]|nr:T9SS type A sorting domain-containing protein [Flavobacteriales bacterium]
VNSGAVVAAVEKLLCIIEETDELMKNPELKLYPNPSNGQFRIEMDGIDNINVTVYNSIGQIVQVESVIYNSIYKMKLLSNFPGIYYVTISAEGHERVTKKLIVLGD